MSRQPFWTQLSWKPLTLLPFGLPLCFATCLAQLSLISMSASLLDGEGLKDRGWILFASVSPACGAGLFPSHPRPALLCYALSLPAAALKPLVCWLPAGAYHREALVGGQRAGGREKPGHLFFTLGLKPCLDSSSILGPHQTCPPPFHLPPCDPEPGNTASSSCPSSPEVVQRLLAVADLCLTLPSP